MSFICRIFDLFARKAAMWTEEHGRTNVFNGTMVISVVISFINAILCTSLSSPNFFCLKNGKLIYRFIEMCKNMIYETKTESNELENKYLI